MALPTLHRLRIAAVRAETADSISVAFDVPAELRDAYRFRAGQFLTLAASPDGEPLRRSYSICSSEREFESGQDLRVGIRRVAGGRFSNWANNELKVGQELEVMTPDGRFGIDFSPGMRRHYLGIAGGSGITPLLSIVKTALETEADSRFTLVYGNRTLAAIMFLEEIEGLKNRYLERLSIFHVLSEEVAEIELLSGLLDQPRIAALLSATVPPDQIAQAFICGPAPMMDAAERALLANGLAPERIRIERFASPETRAALRAPAPVHDPEAVAPAVPASRVTLVIDGKARQLAVPYDGASILDTALAAGIGLPYACKAGVCCTCRARVLEGEVRMDKQYTLEQHELDTGFVLTCQSHPLTETVRVSFDER
jgi:ring-1,2-phenylacetyl-CoA epoxidase subunit PaaE